ncbi:MAG: hypothetical protein HDR88_12620 [Bacteroides sp.]|nr:hypothetical protein [Bacteroides sp.]
MTKENVISAISKAESFISEGIKLGLPLKKEKEKLEKALSMVESNEISIALLGSFSDGKTTVISGLIGRVMDNMKIDANESSDEIEIYEVPFLGKKFRFVDTPGLFGTKEKEIKHGNKVRFSSITEDYISQANAVIYVTEASNPLPESHQEPLRHIMRDLRKLDSTIFVINKMDEKYDTLDDYEYREGVRIKTKNLTDRLQRCLDLNNNEILRLKIVCLAADPKGKGLNYWLNHFDSYAERSHINVLKDEVSSVAGDLRDDANVKAALDTSIDVMENLGLTLIEAKRPVEEAIKKILPISQDLKHELAMTRTVVLEEKKSMISNLESLEADVKTSILSMSQDTAAEVLHKVIGVSKEGIDFSIVIRKIESAMKSCSDSVNVSVTKIETDVIKGMDLAERIVSDAMSKGVKQIKNVKIDKDMVGKIRDMCFKNHKFKPYGKIKMANKINVGIGRLYVVIGLAIEIYDFWKKHKKAKEFESVRNELLDVVTNIFNEAHKSYSNEEVFLKNFAPTLTELKSIIDQKDKEIEKLKETINRMDKRREDIMNWKREFIEDVEYTVC